MENIEWKSRAEALFFIEKYNINDISKEIKISRRSISKYLNSLSDYEEENERRKNENKIRRKEYQNNWDKTYRSSRYSLVTGDTMRVEHDLAVLELSRERYF